MNGKAILGLLTFFSFATVVGAGFRALTLSGQDNSTLLFGICGGTFVFLLFIQISIEDEKE